jgi:hypothetical protein
VGFGLHSEGQDELEEVFEHPVFHCLVFFSLLLPSDGEPSPPFIDVNCNSGRRPKRLAALAQSFGKVGEVLDWTELPDRRCPVAIPPRTLATLSHSSAREEVIFARGVRCNLTIVIRSLRHDYRAACDGEEGDQFRPRHIKKYLAGNSIGLN